MKRIILTLSIVVMLIVTTAAVIGCYRFDSVVGSHDLETREFDYIDFTRVEVSSAIQVEVIKTDDYRVSITADDNLFEYIEHSLSGDTLRFRLRPFLSFRNTTVQLKINMPELRYLELSGACSGEIDGFQSTGSADFDISGASKLNIISLQVDDTKMDISGASKVIGSLTTQEADFDVSGASSLELVGSASNARLEASGASILKLSDFNISDASIQLSGASNGNIEISGTLDIDLSGASSLVFGGNPTLGYVEVSGASSMKRR